MASVLLLQLILHSAFNPLKALGIIEHPNTVAGIFWPERPFDHPSTCLTVQWIVHYQKLRTQIQKGTIFGDAD